MLRTRRDSVIASLIWAGAATIVGTLLRAIALDQSPPGMFCDEASVGYDAWSIWQSGRDQWGQLMPLFARSFGDYDEAAYRWLAAPVVGIFGLSVTTTRLPAALIGSATIPAVYLLAREIDERRAAPWAAISIAISPWHMLFSRVAFRAVLLPMTLAWGVALVLRARRTAHGPTFFAGAIFIALSLWSYSPARILVPAIGVVLLVTHGGVLVRHRIATLASAILVVAWGARLASFWVSSEGMARADQVLHADSAALVLDHYASYFRPGFLVESGDPNLRHHVPRFAQLLWVDGALVVVGFATMIARFRRTYAVLLLWLFVAPIPAALTEGVHSLRAIGMVPALAVSAGIGARVLWVMARTRAKRAALVVTLVLAAGGQSADFVHRLFSTYPQEASDAWMYGMGEALATARTRHRPCMLLTNELPVPHIYVLFYERVPPQVAWQFPLRENEGHTGYTRHDIGSYHIRPLADGVTNFRECAFIATAGETRPPDAEHLSIIRRPDGTPALQVFVLPR